jgi:small-conductance mechanosensitive channel
MDRLLDLEFLKVLFADAQLWVEAEVLIFAALWELGAIAVTLALARIIAIPFRNWLEEQVEKTRLDARRTLVWRTLLPLTTPIIWVILLWIAVAATDQLELRDKLMSIVVSLVNAWIVIRFITQFVREQVWARFIAVVVWIIAALNIVGLLQPALDLLDGIALKVGQIRITALGIIEGLFYLVLLLWLAHMAASLLERRMKKLPNITPSMQVLFSKLLKILLVTIAVFVTVNSVGIDLTALAVFGGALGVGIGFGLQKIVSNFISGIILLMDRSIKPGDTIGVAGTYGSIQSLGARYVSVITRDGIEHLIPNEELIVTRVENWSFSAKLIRLRAPVGVSYGSDIHQAIALCVAATEGEERILDNPQPVCLLKGFGDSSVDLEIRFWIRDPQNGVSNIKSKVLLRVWDLFEENGIEIPFPQRDLHLRSVTPDARALIEGSDTNVD